MTSENISPSRKRILRALRAWLGKDGIEDFTEYEEKYGTVSPVIGPQKPIKEGGSPHPVHFREGMQVRNFLRTLPETKNWMADDFDNKWSDLITEALVYPD